jgi:exosortase
VSRTGFVVNRQRRVRATAPHVTPAVSSALIPWTAALALVSVALLWSYWPTIAHLTKEWQSNEDYSVGQLVPLAALYLVWHDRRRLRTIPLRPCWWGVGLIILAQIARAYGLLFIFESAERYSFVLTIAGIVLLLGGTRLFFNMLWILALLFLMVPFPGRIHNMISGPLQGMATAGAVFVLELIGITVLREGNVILLNDSVPLAVAEACSGLRMLTAFVVVAATMAYMVRRPTWQKLVLLSSSIPVAIVCNIIRLVVTALLFLVASSRLAERFFHDFAGLTMMPLALLILLSELWLLNKLILPSENDTAGNSAA